MTNATQTVSITTEARPNSQLAATIEVTADRAQQVYNHVLNDLIRHTQLPGFRKGKAPKQLLLKQIGTQRLRHAAMEKLIEDTVKEAVQQERIAYLGNLKLEGDAAELLEQFDPQQPFRFSVTFDVEPEITPSTYQGLTVEYAPVTYDPATVDEVLRQYQRQQATLVPVEDRPAQWGDEVTLKLVTKKPEGDEVIKELSASELPLTLDETQPFLLPEILGAVVGMAIGESKTVSITLPKEENGTEVTGEAVAEIELLEIKAPELPPLDDAFAEEHSEFSTMAELRAHLEKMHQERAENEDKLARENALVDVLLAQNEVPVPTTYIDKEAEAQVRQNLMHLQDQGLDLSKVLTRELYEKLLLEAKPQAEKTTKANLLIEAIAKAEGIVPSEEAVAERVKSYLSGWGKVNAKQRQALHDIAHKELTKSQTLDWLLAHNTFQALSPTAEEAPTTAPEIEAPAAAKAKKRPPKKASAPPAAE